MIVAMLTAAGLVTASQASAPAPLWSAVAIADNVVMGVERRSVTRTGDEVTFSMLNAWRRSDAGAYAVAQVRMDCAARTFRIGERKSYDAEGRQIGVFSSEGPLGRVEAGSTLALVAAAVCDDVWPGAFSAATKLAFYQRSITELALRP